MNKDKIIANMNEDQIINYIQENNYAGVRLSPGEKHLIGKTVERVKGIIQSEPEETKGVENDAFKTNFDMITESPEQLAEFLTHIADFCSSAGGQPCEQCRLYKSCQNTYGDDIQSMKAWLTGKAGE